MTAKQAGPHRARSRGRAVARPPDSKPAAATNQIVASALLDLASIQRSIERKWAYRRAAETILGLQVPLESFVLPNGTLRKIPNIGPSSSRVILEVLRTGASSLVDAPIAAAGRTA